jgi:membrane protein
MLGMIWTMSAAFDSMIEALDIAYDANDDRPCWKTRLLAIALDAVVGARLLAALAVMVVGPRFGDWLASRLALSAVFPTVWPFPSLDHCHLLCCPRRRGAVFCGCEGKQRFGATLPGAVLSVVVWNAGRIYRLDHLAVLDAVLD